MLLDFTKLLGSVKYQHAAEDTLVSVNDDRIRTWTVSSHDEADIRSRTFKIIMREKPNGAVTGMLFRLARKLKDIQPDQLVSRTHSRDIAAEVVGVAGDFVLPMKSRPLRALWVAGGIGLTLFIAFLGALSKRATANVNAVLALSTREPEVLVPFIRAALGGCPLPAAVQLRLDIFTREEVPSVKLFDGLGEHVKVKVFRSRISEPYSVEFEAAQRDVRACGPESFEGVVIKGLEKAGVNGPSIQREGFQD